MDRNAYPTALLGIGTVNHQAMNPRLGIIGGGQLALYLCEAARKLGVETCVLAEEAGAPAGAQATRLLVGDPADADILESFIASSNVVTFDKEDIPNECLHRLGLAEREGRILVRPGAETLFLLKDKGLQKTWLQEQGFPTLPFRLLQGEQTGLDSLREEFPLVQKARCGGYDGRGVQILKTPEQIEQLWSTPSLLEPFIADCREVAVLLARDSEGNSAVYPVFGMDFDPRLNALNCVYTPAAIEPEIAAEAADLGRRVVDALGGIGVFAIEMFLTPGGELLVNEISPRVHNSGHLTKEASAASQFEQHVRAVIGLPLAGVDDTRPAAMVNILYRDGMAPSCPEQPTAYQHDQLTLHWYGKPPGRDGRKMGHITALADDAGKAAAEAQRALADLHEQADTQAA